MVVQKGLNETFLSTGENAGAVQCIEGIVGGGKKSNVRSTGERLSNVGDALQQCDERRQVLVSAKDGSQVRRGILSPCGHDGQGGSEKLFQLHLDCRRCICLWLLLDRWNERGVLDPPHRRADAAGYIRISSLKHQLLTYALDCKTNLRWHSQGPIVANANASTAGSAASRIRVECIARHRPKL